MAGLQAALTAARDTADRLTEENRRLKATPGDYERRKREFFERVVALL